MPMLGVGHILTLVVKPTVGSIGVPLVVDIFEAVEAVIMSTQVIMLVILLVIMAVILLVIMAAILSVIMASVIMVVIMLLNNLTQGFVISLPYCFLNSEVRGAVRSQWRRWQMVRFDKILGQCELFDRAFWSGR